jgi:hypothetical protein
MLLKSMFNATLLNHGERSPIGEDRCSIIAPSMRNAVRMPDDSDV